MGTVASLHLAMDSPFGTVRLESTAHGISRLHFVEASHPGGSLPFERPARLPDGGTGEPGTEPLEGEATASAALLAASEALRRYFGGMATDFRDLPVDLTGLTPYQRGVLKVLRDVGVGCVVTYGDLSDRVPTGSARSTGQALGANPLPVILPCHRVVGCNGQLGGYSGGLNQKRRLLELEGVHVEGNHIRSRAMRR